MESECRALALPPLSAVAGIIDHGKGHRTVVGPLLEMYLHQGPTEKLYLVPGLWVREPVPWDDIPFVIAQAEKRVRQELDKTNKCGACQECCKTPYLKTQHFEKASYTKCHNCVFAGCKVYADRPLQCESFKCLWLRSQETDTPMAPELRPDRALVILTTGEEPGKEDVIYIHPQRRVPVGGNSCHISKAMGEWLGERPTMIVTHYYGESIAR